MATGEGNWQFSIFGRTQFEANFVLRREGMGWPEPRCLTCGQVRLCVAHMLLLAANFSELWSGALAGNSGNILSGIGCRPFVRERREGFFRCRLPLAEASKKILICYFGIFWKNYVRSKNFISNNSSLSPWDEGSNELSFLIYIIPFCIILRFWSNKKSPILNFWI